MVIDILEGFERQTYESLEILKARKTPFLVASNKIDRIPGWRVFKEEPLLSSLKRQEAYVQDRFNELILNIIYEFMKLGFKADRFDKVRDFTKTVAIVPTSALTGEGVPELLMVLCGLTQQYMSQRLMISEGPAKATVLEVREEPGLGVTADVIVYDGVIRKGDMIVVGGFEKPVATKVRALLIPKPLDEMRDPEDRFKSVDEVAAAAGVKIVAQDLEGVVAGAPLYVVEGELEGYERLVSEEVEALKISTQINGVIVKTDTLGSLEALTESFKRLDIPIRMADVGPVSKRDVVEASIVKSSQPHHGVIIAFNVKLLPEAEYELKQRNIMLFRSNVIYKLLEDYQKWLNAIRERERMEEFEGLIKPGKIRLIPSYVFRRSHPAIVGVDVQVGYIKPGYVLMKSDGGKVGEIMQIQDKGKTIPIASTGQAVAISIKGNIVIGRHIKEGETLYVDVPEAHLKTFLTKFKDKFTPEELRLIDELASIKKGRSPS